MTKKYHGKSYRKNNHVSANSGNRKLCVGIFRQKFCTETYEKALKACKYSPNPQRVYYCDFCCAYHTTKILDKECFNATKSATRNQFMREGLERRQQSKKKSGRKLKKKLRKAEKLYLLNRVRKVGYHQSIEDYLIKCVSKSGEDKQLVVIKSKLAEIFKSLKNPADEKMEEIIAETLKWPFCSIADAIGFFVLFYLESCGWLMLRQEDKNVLDALFYIDSFSEKTLDKVRERVLDFINTGAIIGTKMTGDIMIYKLPSPRNSE